MTDPVTRADRNMLHAATCWALAAEDGRFWERDGVLCVGAAAPLRSFNQVFVTDSDVSAGSIRSAVAEFTNVGRKCRMRLLSDLAERLHDTLEAAGLERQGGIPSLALTRPVEPSALPEGLTITPVNDERTLAEHRMVVASAFEWTTGDLDRVFTPKLLDDPDWSAYVAYAGGEPVATAQLVVHEGVAGLYYIGTLDAARRKGYADAVTRHAIGEGFARGCDVATLQASPMGKPVYERLGFETVAEYATYVPATPNT